jgi:hypothetical protein
MADKEKDKYKEYGEYGRLPDNVFESHNSKKYPSIYRTTNALVFPLKLIDDEEVLIGEELSAPDDFES